MKNNSYRILRVADADQAGGPPKTPAPAAPPPSATNPPGAANRAVKTEMVTVRAGARHVHVDGFTIEPKTEAKIQAARVASLGNLVTKVAAIAVLLLCGFAARAQQYSAAAVAITNGATIKFDGSSTTNQTVAASTLQPVNDTITLTKYDQVGFQVSFKLMAAGTAPVPLVFAWSGDGTTWVPNYFTMSITPNGTTMVQGINWTNVGPVGYMQFTSISNNNNSPITNLMIKPLLKPSRNGS
jgi:hypothetical protein